MAAVKKAADMLTGTSFGTADKIIKLAFKDQKYVSAADKVVYSTYQILFIQIIK